MTQHDPDLCARVAKVMGLEYRIGTVRTTFGDQEMVLVRYPHTREWRKPFCPDTDPADAWRVLEWCIAEMGWFATMSLVGEWLMQNQTVDDPKVWLCNAVAALGGQGR